MLAYWGRTRGLLNHFELNLGSVFAYENMFGIIMVSSYAHEAQLSKTLIVPMDFNDFIGFPNDVLMIFWKAYNHVRSL